MKYLKKINFLNESLSNLDLEEVEDLTILSLSYLIDDTLEVSVDFNDVVISISIGGKDGSILEWNNIKDSIIPLFNLLNSRYILQQHTAFFDENNDYLGYTLEQIINDNVEIKGVEGILIFITGKKN
jgi:hypothetical protein